MLQNPTNSRRRPPRQRLRSLLNRVPDYAFTGLAWSLILVIAIFVGCTAVKRQFFPWELTATALILIGAILTALGVSLSEAQSAHFRQRQSQFRELGEAPHVIRKEEILHLEAMTSEMLEALLDASFYGRLGLACIVIGSVALMVYQAFD